MVSIYDNVLYYIFLSLIFTDMVNTQGVFLQNPTIGLGEQYRAEYSGYSHMSPMPSYYLTTLYPEFFDIARPAVQGKTNIVEWNPGHNDKHPIMEFWTLTIPIRPSLETFKLDTIVAQQGHTTEVCGMSALNGRRTNCMFNEVVICANVGEWM